MTPVSALPRVVFLTLAVVLFGSAGAVALGLGDGNYAALVAFGSAAFAAAWIVVPRG